MKKRTPPDKMISIAFDAKIFHPQTPEDVINIRVHGYGKDEASARQDAMTQVRNYRKAFVYTLFDGSKPGLRKAPHWPVGG